MLILFFLAIFSLLNCKSYDNNNMFSFTSSKFKDKYSSSNNYLSLIMKKQPKKIKLAFIF